ncbi:MAG TPA: carbohydrate porin [Kofleriaceae bacterium]|nr:carbohydrate porin [Kofleriaceae bacterium]
MIPISDHNIHGGAGTRRLPRLATLAAAAALVAGAAPRPAAADIPGSNADFMYYGRMGVGWTPSGQVVAGKYMNLGDHKAIGGRLEEGDYLEPGIRYHIKKAEHDGDTSVDLVTDFEIFSLNGAIVSDLANGDISDIKIMPLQAYIQAKNVVIPGLTLWIGSNLYRKSDIHICDYFYFNSLPGQGVGAYYGGLDVAVLTQTGASSFFATDLNAGMPAPATPAIVQRERTMLIGQYSVPLGIETSYVQGLGEFHVVPKAGDATRDAADGVNPTDYGMVGGVKLHLDLGDGDFTDSSVRIGDRIANGAESGGSTYSTFGEPGTDGTYSGALGLEVVEHFLWNVDKMVSINGYGTLHFSRGSTAAAVAVPNNRFDYSFGARPTFYLSDQLHLITEATFQTRKDEGRATGTAVKLSIAPTVVPTGERSAWARPELRLIYTLGLYNQAAVDQRMSPFLQAMGPNKVAHFLGVRTEWWF